jgi:dTDP-glucose 4,6-dehydratase
LGGVSGRLPVHYRRFVGHWLLSSFAAANQRFGLNARALVLTRDAAGFKKRAPELVRDPAISLHPGDVRTFDFLSGDFPSGHFPPGKFSHIIHGATPASAALNSERPLEMQDIIIEGTRRVLDLARQSHGAKLLLCSSGLRQPGS